jgi:hypothetical protein
MFELKLCEPRLRAATGVFSLIRVGTRTCREIGPHRRKIEYSTVTYELPSALACTVAIVSGHSRAEDVR